MTDPHRLTAAFQRVDALEPELIRRLRMVLGVDNCVPPGRNYDTLIDTVEPEFRRLGFDCERVVIPEAKVRQIPLPLDGPRVNLVARQATGRPPLTIYAHMDTVPIEESWTKDPFAGEIIDGRMYGRGVADMKGTIATTLTAFDVIRRENLKLAWDPIVCLCTDEEIGTYPGIYHLALAGYLKAPILCLEGSQEPVLRAGSNGAVDITVTVHGRSCHSGANYLGVNALEATVPIMVELLALKRTVEARRSALPLAPRPGAPDRLSPMFNLDIIQAGVKSNIVPSVCTLIINRRYVPEENYDDVCAEIQVAVDRGRANSPALDVTVEFNHVYPSYHQGYDHPLAQKLKSALKLVQGYTDADFVISGSGGSTDMAFVSRVLNTTDIATVGAGRMGESRAHGSDESIRMSDALAHVKELIYILTDPG